jgi:restriction endonuclease S subunit
VKNINPYYLYVYLKTRYGREQTIRFRSGAAQPNISMPNLKAVLVYTPPLEQQEEIEHHLFRSYHQRANSERLYSEAEALLLQALGLDQLDLSPKTTYTALFSEAFSAGRLDPDIFQPKYQVAMAQMGKSGLTIGNVCELQQRQFKPIRGKSFHYIEIGDLNNNGRMDSSQLMGEDAPSRAQYIVHTGDVITSVVRPIRRLSAIIDPHQHGYVCSSGFAVLHPKRIPPEVLQVYLRLPIVCEVLDLHTTATMYPAISIKDLLNIPISLPNRIVTDQVVEKVKESRRAVIDSLNLLEEAKHRVEQMILGEGA